MTTIQIELPEATAEAARDAGLLTPQALERLLNDALRKTIDTIIATRCIESGYTLLHSDRDFDAFETHLGLLVMSSGK